MKHQEFWQAVARGEAEQWEGTKLYWKDGDYVPCLLWLEEIYKEPDVWTLRRKPRTITVNGVECVAGYEGEIEFGTEVAFPYPISKEGFATFTWFSSSELSQANDYRKMMGVYIGPDKETHAGAVGRAMRLPTEAMQLPTETKP